MMYHTVGLADRVRHQYPNSVLLGTAIKLAHKEIEISDAYMKKISRHYEMLSSFKERKEYYEKTIKPKEVGYKALSWQLNNFLTNRFIQPYEYWLDDVVYERMKRLGFKETVRRELLFIT